MKIYCKHETMRFSKNGGVDNIEFTSYVTEMEEEAGLRLILNRPAQFSKTPFPDTVQAKKAATKPSATTSDDGGDS